MQHSLPQLPYDYNALEPHIDEQTMRIHHTKHHQTYVDKLNAALATPEGQGLPKKLEDLLMGINSVPESIKMAVRNHGGGHFNHSFFWQIMSGDGGDPEEGPIDAIKEKFGSFEKFKELFSNSAAGHFGSGWCWLVLNNGQLEIITLPNQDSPIMTGKTPLLGIDVWEHAYYIKYQNKRPDYIAAWFNVINWSKVMEHYENAQ